MISRRAGLAALAAFVLAGAARAQGEAPPTASWLQRRIETGLAQAMGGTARIGRMDVDWTSLSAAVEDVRIEVPAGDAPPLVARMGSARVRLAWSGLTGLAAGQIHITEVVARDASFACSREWIDSWRPRPSARKGGVEVRVDRLVVENAEGEYTDARQRVRLHATGLGFQGDWSTARRLLVGEVRGRVSVDAPLFERPWPAEIRGGLRIGAGRLEIFSARGDGPGALAELTGNVTWGAGASFTAQGRLDADFAGLSPFLPAGLKMRGRASGPVQIVFAGGAPVRVTAQTDTTGLGIGPIDTETARAELTIRPGRLDVARIDGRAYGGSITGSVGVSFGGGLRFETDVAGAEVDLGRIVALAGRTLPISSRGRVTLRVAGEPGRVASWVGEGTFDAAAAPAGGTVRIPTAGRGRIVFAPGHIRLEGERLELAGATLRLTLDATSPQGDPALTVVLDGTTRDARAT